MTPCKIVDCDRPCDSHGYCQKHATRWRRHGDPNREPLTRSQIFWSSVDKSGECWLWTGPLTRQGYGKFGQHSQRAHRFAWCEVNGTTSLPLDHLCMEKRCVRPDHLEPVTQAENVRRASVHYGIRSAKTHCPRGHEYSPENTAHRGGKRHCRSCNRERAARNRERNRRNT